MSVGAYWSTGITICREYSGWKIYLKFFDGGFCEKDSTEGELRVRYLVKDEELSRAIDVLKADAERFGIDLKYGTVHGTIYYEGDGEAESACPPPKDWREIATREAERIGFRAIYKEIDEMNAAEESQ